MRISLIDVDGHGRKEKWGATVFPNLALCKIASYHKSRGAIKRMIFMTNPFEVYEPRKGFKCGAYFDRLK